MMYFAISLIEVVPGIILSVLGIIGAVAVSAAYYKRSRGQSTIDLLEANSKGYQEALKIKDDRITWLEAQNYSQNETIKNLNKLLTKAKHGKS